MHFGILLSKSIIAITFYNDYHRRKPELTGVKSTELCLLGGFRF